MKSFRLVGVLLVVVACVALAGAAIASKAPGSARKAPHRVHVQSRSGEQSSESESGGDSESGQQGEPAQGHEDPPGQDVNHECTGNCQE
jgi:hypothetical protein